MVGMFVRHRLKASLIFLLLCWGSVAWTQYQIPFINYSMKDGLAQNQVRDICQDHQGYIWIATAGGVSKFDGKSFKNFTVAEGLPVNTVTALLVDRKNRIWMTTYGGGVTVFDRGTFHTYTTKDGLATNNLVVDGFNRFLMEDSRGNIWCRTNEDGVSVIDGHQVKTFNRDNGLIDNNVTCFAEDRQGRILCGTRLGLSVIDHGQISNYTFGNDSLAVWNIVIDRSGKTWVIGESDHIAQLVDGKSFVYHSFPEPCQFIAAMVDSHNCLWLSTVNSGIYTFDGQTITHISRPDEPITRIYEDKQSNIWLLTFGNGVYRLNDDNLEYYSSQYGLTGDNTTCVLEDGEENIWIGTDSGISMYGKVIFETLTMASGLPNNHIISVAADKMGNIWCGPQNSGLVKINGHQVTFYESRHKDKRMSTNAIISIDAVDNKLILGSMGAGLGYFENGKFVFDNKPGEEEEVYDALAVDSNEYWAASSKGLIHMSGGHEKYYTVDDGLPDNRVYFLARDHKNRIWCTTTLGLSVFDGKQFTNYTTENGLPNNSCTDIAIDKNGVVWLGTENGLCKITETGHQLDFKVYSIKDGLASNSISLVHADQSNCLWVGYVNGLNTIDLETGKIKYFAEEDGYFPMDCYMGAAATDTQGKVWFGTVAGLVRYNPAADQKRTVPPRTYITNISLTDGGDILQYADSISVITGLPENLVLPYNRNTIQIDWIGIHFTIPDKNRYRFILEGHEKNWHEWSNETFREYQLSPGHYTFKVMACNNDGVWNQESVTYSFEVRSPWWATTFAYIAYVLTLIALVYLYVRWRERKLVKENRILEEKIHERTIEIELQNQNIIEINKALKEHQEELIIQRDMAAGQRDQIAEQRQEIMDSIHYAKRIQTAIMPTPEVMRQIIPDYFLFFRPRDVVSGDFYWAASKGNKSVVVAADCTGHGVPGAFMSMLGISILNEIVLKQKIEKASDILDELRTNLKAMLSQTGAAGEQRDGMDVALCLIDYDAMELQYAGAYNSLYLVRNNELIEYKADKMPVGVHVGMEKKFSNHTVSLVSGDMLYIFSDGYIDQFGGENDTKFKTKPFKQLLVDISTLPVEQQRGKLVEVHECWKGSGKQIDDIIVIGIRIIP